MSHLVEVFGAVQNDVPFHKALASRRRRKTAAVSMLAKAAGEKQRDLMWRKATGVLYSMMQGSLNGSHCWENQT